MFGLLLTEKFRCCFNLLFPLTLPQIAEEAIDSSYNAFPSIFQAA